MGIVSDPRCLRCGAVKGSLAHRHCGCRVTAETRIQHLGIELADECDHADENSWWWERALIPHPKIGLTERPTGDQALPEWYGTHHETLAAHSLLKVENGETAYADCPYPLNGDVYSDGSGSFPKSPHRRRIAYSAVVVQDGKPQTCVSGPLDHPLQIVVGGELKTSAMAAGFSPPHALYHVDCEAIIKGAKRGMAWCSDPTRPYADLWREWWAARRQNRDGAETLRKVKAHTTAADIDIKISDTARIGNDLADAIAKESMKRFPQDFEAQDGFAKAKRAVTAWAK